MTTREITISDFGSSVLQDIADLQLASIGNLDPAKYQGQLTSLAHSIPAAGTAGRWYYSTVAGTLTDSDAGSAVVQQNGYLIDTGSAWLARNALVGSVPIVNFADGLLAKVAEGPLTSGLNIGLRFVNGKRVYHVTSTSANTILTLPVTAGDVLYFAATGRMVSGTSASLSIRFRNVSAGFISDSAAQTFTATTWTRKTSGAIAAPANSATVELRMSGLGSSVYDMTDFYIGPENPLGRQVHFSDSDVSALVASTKVAYIAPASITANTSGPLGFVNAGSDSTGEGSSRLPFLTLEKALATIGRTGTVYIYCLTGRPWDVANLAVSSQCHDVTLRFIGTDAIRGGTKLATITKTGGQTKVYEAPLAGDEVTLRWIWEDDTNEAATEIQLADRHPLNVGRTHRLPCTRIYKCDETTLAAALTEIDAATEQKYFHDVANSKIYFSHTGGVATPTKDFCIPNFSASPWFAGWSNFRRLTLDGLKLRYMQIFNRTGSNEAATDAVRCSFLGSNASTENQRSQFSMCEFMGHEDDGSGTFFDSNTYHHCWFHDNGNDGYSNHSTQKDLLVGCISEYNIGAGFIPALGAGTTFIGCTSRYNAITGSNKQGGFVSLAGTNDTTNRTTVICIGCTSYGDRNGFFQSPTFAELRAINCTAINPGGGASPNGRGFDNCVVINCYQSGETTASNPVSVVNGTLVS